jgi:integrase
MARGKDGLYKREGDILAFRYKDADGRWKEKYTGKTKRSEARDFKADFEAKLKAGELPNEKANQTVEQAAKRWIEQHAARLTSEKAKKNEKSFFNQLTRRLGARKLKSITLDDLKDYQQARREQVRERPINLELKILVSVLKEANLWRPIGEHYKRLKEPESDVGQALTLAQLQQIEKMAATKDAWQVAYYAEVLAANTGLRGGEIKKLKLGSIDLENRRIRITRKDTKSNAGARLIELNSAAMESICKLYVRAQSLGANEPEHYLLLADLSRHTKNTDPLKGGRGFDATRHQVSWDTAWRNLRKAAAGSIRDAATKEQRELTGDERETIALFEALRFHDLRHTFISLMGERGVPIQIVQAMVGHMSGAMVRYYTHISNRAAREAVELLDKAPENPFVGNFVGKEENRQPAASKRLN